MQMDLELLALISSLTIGLIVLLSVCWVYVKHQRYGFNGAGLSLFGVILVGITQWSSIQISLNTKDGINAEFQRLNQEISELKVLNEEISEELTQVSAQYQQISHSLQSSQLHPALNNERQINVLTKEQLEKLLKDSEKHHIEIR